MKLHINGEERLSIPRSFTLAALVEILGMKADRVAVELNRDIVPRDRWSETLLNEGDRLEVVHFVGGGSELRSPPGTLLVTPSPPILCLTPPTLA